MFEDKDIQSRELIYSITEGRHLCATCRYANDPNKTTSYPHSCEFFSRIVEKHGDWTELGIKSYDINIVRGNSLFAGKYIVDNDYKDEGMAGVVIIAMDKAPAKLDAYLRAQFIVTFCQRHAEAPGVKYNIYLHSEEWRSRRMVAIEKAGYRCQICGSCLNLDVHHISYDRLGHEADDDLIAVCRKCHEALHSGKYRLEARTNGRRY